MHKKRHSEHEEGGEVGLWYVSFADMITLLLAFFVMLTSFSSYDRESLRQINSTSVKTYTSVFQLASASGANSVIVPIDSVSFRTEGNELGDGGRLTRDDPENRTSDAAYDRKKVVTIPAETMFLGQSAVLTEAGQRCLDLMAQFLRLMPCRVHISARGASHVEAAAGAVQSWDERQWAVAQGLIRRGVIANQIGLSGEAERALKIGPGAIVVTLYADKGPR